MKRSFLVLTTLVFLVFISCKQKIDITKEKEAVLKVLQEEGDAHVANDIKRIAAIHIQDSTDTRLAQGPDSYKIYKGWDEIKEMYKNLNQHPKQKNQNKTVS